MPKFPPLFRLRPQNSLPGWYRNLSGFHCASGKPDTKNEAYLPALGFCRYLLASQLPFWHIPAEFCPPGQLQASAPALPQNTFSDKSPPGSAAAVFLSALAHPPAFYPACQPVLPDHGSKNCFPR